jgi:hypothetical protein
MKQMRKCTHQWELSSCPQPIEGICIYLDLKESKNPRTAKKLKFFTVAWQFALNKCSQFFCIHGITSVLNGIISVTL